MALEVGLRPAIYGTGWEEFVDRDLIVSDFMPNEQLPSLYSSVGVLLNDHWDTMRAWGVVSNRLFDALACSTPIVSRPPPGDHRSFQTLSRCTTPADLQLAVETALDDPVAARKHAAAGREVVLHHHSFDHRAAELIGRAHPPRRRSAAR
jgi:spore maturation protein CgeB